MFPSDASIYLAPISVDKYYSDKVDFWKKVYDVDMSVLMYSIHCACCYSVT
jgi:hypothetical protein